MVEAGRGDEPQREDKSKMIQNTPFEVGVARQIGSYADAVRVPAGYDLVFLSGTPGITPDGVLPDGITAQSEQAWKNVQSALEAAGARLGDIVSVHHWLKHEADIPAYVAVRNQFISHQPVYMLAVVPSLVRDDFLVEVEVIAAVASPQFTGQTERSVA
jgi:2-iminobutanoate/2-iminopropanoate deaminase